MRRILHMLVLLFSLSRAQAQSDEAKLKIEQLSGDFHIYTTYNLYEGTRIPAHGMYLITREGVVLFDTPWDSTQCQPLLDSIQQKHHQAVTVCLATHWHSDRTEGLEYYRKKGIKTFTTVLTDQLCEKHHKKRAQYLITKDTVFNLAPYSFQTYYPGPGHTADNIVIWFPNQKILYGGCLIKGADAEDLGYLGDANTAAYETTLRRVQKKCPNPKFIIVSHSNWRNANSMNHSIKLAQKLKK